MDQETVNHDRLFKELLTTFFVEFVQAFLPDVAAYVYPVVIFSYDKPKRAEPNRYTVTFPGETVLQFKYKVIQLNRLSWRQFVKQPNPVAAALMSKMKMSPQDRPRVKVECLRLLATLKLDPARTRLIGNFIDSYLKLSRAEQNKYERELATLAPNEKEATVEITNSWERTGMERVVLRLLHHRFGNLPSTLQQRIDDLSADQLDKLSDSLFEITTPAELETRLSQLLAQ